MTVGDLFARQRLDPGEPASKGPRLSGISRRKALAALALVLLVTVSFFPAYLAEFVWDDFVLTEDPFGEERFGAFHDLGFASRDGVRRALLAGRLHDLLAGAQTVGAG